MRPRWHGTEIVTLLTLVALAAGCSVIEIERQAEVLTRSPLIYGDVKPEAWGGAPLVVVLSRDASAGESHLVEYVVKHDPGPFSFYVEPGTYQLAAFEDRSGNLMYEPSDPALVPGRAIEATLEDPSVHVDLAGPLSTKTALPDRFDVAPDSKHTTISLAHRNIGRVVTMGSREMSLELGQVGMWEPEKYMEEVQVGLFLLEPFDESKIPVVFVHGIGGAPIQFEALAGALDRERYQPFFFAYPSIFPLHMIADALNAILDILRRQHEFTTIHLVAHSMGGLVTRAYLNEYLWSRHDYEVDLFVSLASPFGGESGASIYPAKDLGEQGPMGTWIANMRSAEGDSSHLAWTDMAPDSVFLTNLYAEPLPSSLRYDLVFAFDPSSTLGAPSDGTVTLESQLRPAAQQEATGERGFAMGHDDVLSEPAAVEYVLGVIADVDRRR